MTRRWSVAHDCGPAILYGPTSWCGPGCVCYPPPLRAVDRPSDRVVPGCPGPPPPGLSDPTPPAR